MDIIIEKARPEDAAQVLEYLRLIGSETENLTFGAEGLPFTAEQEEDYIRSLQDSTTSAMFLAKMDSRIIGDASFSSSPRERIRHRGELGISVIREAWGMGIGTRLMEAVLDFARNTAGAEIVQLEVRSDNHRAIRLYEKFGFRKIGVFHGLLKINGELIDCDLMNLYL